jgi:hypothetical protein
VPIGDIAVPYSITSSALVEERFRDRQPKRLRRLEVDDKLELSRLLERYVSRLRSACRRDKSLVRSGSGPHHCARRGDTVTGMALALARAFILP